MKWFVLFPLCISISGFIVSIVGSIEKDIPMTVFGIGLLVIFSIVCMAVMEIMK